MPALDLIQAVSFRLFQVMRECNPENLGPESEFSMFYDDYDDLYRLISWFTQPMDDEGPLLPEDQINRDDVFAIVRGVNDHFHDMVERPDGRQLFDDLRAEDFRLLAYRSGHADFRTERRALESILKPIPHRVDPEDRRSLRRRPIGGHYHYCEACRASGRIDGGRCPSCDGNGGVYETRSDLPCRERM